MSTSRFLKKLTAAEVGNTKTHEVYIRIPNDFDFESFFNNSHIENGSVVEVTFNAMVSTNIIDTIIPQAYDLRFVYFANSNKEKRIPGLGQLFNAYNVNEGDVVCLEKKDNNSYSLTFLSPDTLQIYNGGLLLNGSLEELPLKQSNINPQPLQQIFYGAPGTGKSFTIDDTVDEENSVRTTFHPDSDYASFVGAYKPTMEDMPMSAFVGTNVHPAIPMNGHSGKERKIVYKYVPQAFLKAYVAAWSNLDKPYFLVIEEINRGNCAQIFGDLFQLLDRNNTGSSSYAIHADQDIAQFLLDDKENGFAGLGDEQRNAISGFVLEKDNGKTENIGLEILRGKKLLLPPNLHIWATMNTSDQSLFPIDSAFKRRWNWKFMPIEYAPIDKKTSKPIDWKVEIAGALYSWGAFLAKINPEIYTLTESSDKQMGYFFAKADPNTGIISEDVFLNKVLFYLWTDVFKDFDVPSDYFHNIKQKRPFRFTDFFEDKEALGNFIDNFGLSPVEDFVIGEAQNELNEQNGITASSSSKRKKHFLVWTDKEGNQNKEPLYIGYFNFVKNLVDKFGEDKVADTINSYGITRHNGEVSLMDTKTYPNLNVAYTQKPLGKYYLLLGVNQTTAISKRLNESFNLGLSIEEIAE